MNDFINQLYMDMIKNRKKPVKIEVFRRYLKMKYYIQISLSSLLTRTEKPK
jgi:hypothetical protein